MIAKRAGRLLPFLMIAAVLALVAGAVAAQSDSASPFLGVSVTDDPSGALVVDVLPDGPAAKAGIQADDIITAVDGETAEADELGALMAEYAVGDAVEVDILRGEETLTLTVTLADRADFTLPETTPQTDSDVDVTPEAGTMVQPATPLQHAFLGVSLEDSDDGVTIREVVAGSPAQEAGLEPGDVVTAVNGEAVDTAEGLVATISALAPGDELTLDYTRDGEAQTADITLVTSSYPGRPGNRGQNDGGRNNGQGMPNLMMRGMEVILYDAASESWQVVNVSEDSPLYEAGLRSGDVISAVDGAAYTPDALDEYLGGLDSADAEVTLGVERDGETQEIVLPASALESFGMPMMGFGRGQDFEDMMPFDLQMIHGLGVRLGVTYVDLTADAAAENDVDVTEGALVTEVAADSPAAEAGLLADDIITAVDGDHVDEERTLRDRLAAYEPEDTVTLTVLRDGEETEIAVTLGQAEGGFMGGFGRNGMTPGMGGRNGRGQQGQPGPDSTEMPVPADSPAL